MHTVAAAMAPALLVSRAGSGRPRAQVSAFQWPVERIKDDNHISAYPASDTREGDTTRFDASSRESVSV